MLLNLKAMIVVLTVAMAVFVIAKPVCLRFMTEEDFTRRRNVWIALTLTAFLSPSFWLYAFVAIVVLAWAGWRDPNPAALYLLVLFAIPPGVGLQLPVVGINQLFELDNYRILSFAILVPAAWRLIRSRDKRATGGFSSMDALVLTYAGFQLIQLMPYESITNTMRRAFLLVIDVLVAYFVASRSCTSRRAIVEAMASFCLICAIFAPLALFESLKGWLLYVGIGTRWGSPVPWAYLFRAGDLRAQVSVGHSLALGYIMAIAFGFWLYLGSRTRSSLLTVLGGIVMWIGLIATYSRGPWIVAVVIFFAFLAIGPNGTPRLLKAALISAVVIGLVLISPIGGRVIESLPFVGSVGAGTVTYRERLAEQAWQQIQQHPFLGNPFVLKHLEDLRQGQGIIDLVNAYASVAMFYGLLGLSLFVGTFLVGIAGAIRTAKGAAQSDADLRWLGSALIACMVGTLVMLGIGSLDRGQTLYAFAGLLAAYARLGASPERARADSLGMRGREDPV